MHKLIIKTNDALTDSDYESQQGDDEDDATESTGSSNEEWQETLRILKGVIVQLPNANRDSLCFLFLHFHRLLDSPDIVKVSAEELSRAFAPTIVGSYSTKSTARLSLGDSRREAEKQMMVMQAFFKLSRTFWDRLLKDPTYCPFRKLLTTILVLSYSFLLSPQQQMSLKMQTVPNGSILAFGLRDPLPT